MMRKYIYFLMGALAMSSGISRAQKQSETPKAPILNKETYSALRFRSVGPAVTSGRVIDIAVHPGNKAIWYVAAASGGVWKTENAGTSFKPIFDGQGSYSIGCVAIDAGNPNIIWIGSGENNNQRAVGYGDGIYKSEDGGKTWKNMGLKLSEHIGRIAIDPRNSNIVYVAAYGPLWSAGGERGIYKTTDGGLTWNRVLFVSEHTGFNEVHIDPNQPDVLYATAHQRRRHEWTYISGGPESAVYRSLDSGHTWTKLANGLPQDDMGRIGLAVSPVNTDYIYAIIEGSEDSRGFYRSTDRGASWEKRSSHNTAGNYYTEIFADPNVLDKVYSMDTWAAVTCDGGKTFSKVGEKNKHVDNHALWIDKEMPNHMLMGCDGGLYETWDAAKTWNFKSNLPITQFYRVSVDQDKPFYHIYGGTQDNNTLGGPSRTISGTGIINSDWFVTVGGDGFESVIDPTDPNTVYSQWQYGGLVRFDRRTGEALDIKPQEGKGEPAYKFNWDAPLLISNFNHRRLFFAAQKVFRSDDRGNTWKVISDDLTKGIDRNKLPVMGKVWSMDAVAKNQSTSIYGNITALAESPLDENMLLAGTDDGLVHITMDGGKLWKRIPAMEGNILVQNVYASRHQKITLFAVYNNHRNGDFKPYLMRSKDGGGTWENIGKGLPERGSVYCFAEDPVNAELYFAGTEFGFYFSPDAGLNWIKLSAGLPIIPVRDIAIQERESDIVIATFGRGFYILDDYQFLRKVTRADLSKPAYIGAFRSGLVYHASTPFGHKGKSFQGESFYTADNPPIGVTVPYYIKDDYNTIKELRKEREKALIKAGQPVYYPSADSIRLEDREEAPYIWVVFSDAQGNIVRKMKQPAKKGLYRITWNGRLEPTSAFSFYKPDPDNPYEGENDGPFAIPGNYKVHLELVKNGEVRVLAEPVTFELKTLWLPSNEQERKQADAFHTDLAAFRRVVSGTSEYIGEMENRLKYIQGVVQNIPSGATYIPQLASLRKLFTNIQVLMHGDNSLSRREFETLPGIEGGVEGIAGNLWATTSAPTSTYITRLESLKAQFTEVYQMVKSADQILKAMELELEKQAAPYTPGRLPDWK